MAVAVTEEFLDGALRILSGEALEQEKAIIDQNGGISDFVYVEDSVELPDGTVEQYFISLPKDSSTEQIAHAKEQMVERVKEKWTASYVNSLPDSSFAFVEPGGKKDDEGKTTPRSKRHLPYKDKDGNPDEAHVKNALARLDQTDIPDSAKKTAKGKLTAAAKKLGIEVSEEKEDADSEGDGEGEGELDPNEKTADAEIKLFADEDNKRFPIDTLEDISKSTLAFAQTPYDKYTAPQREAILKRLGERATELQHGDGQPVTKDVSDAFEEALDVALDNALLGAIDSIYYAFVRTFAGSWPDQDADALSRDDFNTLVGKLSEALVSSYDKLADDDDAARAAAMRAEQILTKGMTGLISEGIMAESEAIAASKAGKRHSKHDENRMEIMHGALVGFGYQGCQPVDQDAADNDGDADDAAATKSLIQFSGEDGNAVAAVKALFEKSLGSDGFTYAEKSGVVVTPDGKTVKISSVNPKTVTGSPSHEEPESTDNSDNEAQKRVKEIQAELATVKAQAETSESELSRVKDEQQKRIDDLEAELQEKQAKLEKVQRTPREDPLDRKPVKPTDESREPRELTGARRVNKQFTRELVRK